MSTLRQEGTPGLTEVCCRMHLPVEVADETELGHVHPGRLTFLANDDIDTLPPSHVVPRSPGVSHH